MWSKDLQRTVDYLHTRPDIDMNRIGYLGRSWGAAMGTIMVATEPRLKLAIFLVGGFYFQHGRPEVEAINFAPRVRVPSLMLNGRYDFFYPVDASQSFMFKLIGVPEPQKRWVVYQTSHNLPRENMVDETLRWLDQCPRAGLHALGAHHRWSSAARDAPKRHEPVRRNAPARQPRSTTVNQASATHAKMIAKAEYQRRPRTPSSRRPRAVIMLMSSSDHDRHP